MGSDYFNKSLQFIYKQVLVKLKDYVHLLQTLFTNKSL